MRWLQDSDTSTSGTSVITGGGTTSGGTTYASGPVLTTKLATIAWTHTEPEPVGALQGFEVALLAGLDPDPDDTDTWLRDSTILGPTERILQVSLQLRTTTSVYAAVRALYADDCSSDWTISALPSTFTPSTQTYGESGSVKFPDGTIMQWMVTDAFTGETDHAVTWPTPFLHGCYCVQVTTQMDSADALNDTWFCIRTKNILGCSIFKQASTAAGGLSPTRAHIVAWGY